MRWLYLFSVWLHIVAAAVWLGGMAFLAAVLAPILRQPAHRAEAAALIAQTGRQFRWIGWLCLLLLLATGVVNLASRGLQWTDVWNGQLWAGGFGHTLAAKLFLVAVSLGLSLLHDFLVGPQATAVARTAPGSPAAVRLRRRAAWLGRVNLLLALLIVALAVVLVRG
ncbi:MAG TPA: DUF4149 domain-containing protein [Methylomirabilota bacterium]|nr:DUF4149 domain-containing protein [Methylomirabilota bacterium]